MKTKLLLLGMLFLGAFQLAAQPIVRSGWTITGDPATARAALGVGTGGATNGIQQLNGFGTNTTFEGWTLFNSIKTNNGVVYYPLLTGNRVLSLDANKAVSSSTVTTTELGYLSGTTELLTTSIGNLRGATNGLNTRANNLEGATNGLTTRVNGHDTSIGNLQGATNGLTTRLNGHDTSIANLQGATNGLTTRLNGHDTDIGNLQGATNGLASNIATKADTNSPTLFFPRILNGGGTSNQVWTLTNTVTGQGEWRTVSGVGGGAFPDGGSATNAFLKEITTLQGGLSVPPQLATDTINPTTNQVFYRTLTAPTTITIEGLSSNYVFAIMITQDSVGAHSLTIAGAGEIFGLSTNAFGVTKVLIDGFNGKTNASAGPELLLSSYLAKGDVVVGNGETLGVINLAEGEILLGTNHVNHPYGVAAVDVPSGGGSSYTPLLSTNVTAVSTNFHVNVGVAPANDTTFEIDLAANSGVTIDGGSHRQVITIAFLQDTDGEKTVALTNLFHFPLDLPSPLTLTTNGGHEDVSRWMYHSSSNKWYHLGAIRGFGP